MKKIGKSTFFIVVALIFLFSFTTIVGIDYAFGDTSKTYIKGVDDIRLGIDIKGGVDATFEPADDYDASEDQLKALAATPSTWQESLLISVVVIGGSKSLSSESRFNFRK